MTPRETYIRQIQWSGFEWLSNHQLLGESYWDNGRGARWCIGQNGTFVHRCEIIAGIAGSLVVHGDFDTARFAHYGDHPDAWSRLLWMGKCTDVDYYVAQKAAIGGARVRRDTRHYDSDVARAEIETRVKELDTSHTSQRNEARVLSEALDYVEYEEELRDFLNKHDEWDLWELRFGEVLDAHVIISHLALQKCMYLLVEKYGWEGPPECRLVTVLPALVGGRCVE